MTPKTNKAPAARTSASRKTFVFPTGRDVYDRIMQTIEPELVTANLKKLDAPYKKETAAARTARYKRYAAAFKEYKKRSAAWASRLKKAVNAYKRAVTKAMERINRGNEDNALQDLEAQILKA